MAHTKFGVIGDIENKKFGRLRETLNKIKGKLMKSLRPITLSQKMKLITWKKKP
jgi:hypothetical protein